MKEENIGRVIRNIRIAISNLQLYPKESTLVKDVIKQTYDSLNEFLVESTSIILSEVDQNILVNGKKIEFKGANKSSADAIVNIFVLNNIKSITISSGITLEELNKFLEGLSKKKREKEPPMAISRLIQDNKITHITVNEKVYVAVGEDGKGGVSGQPGSGRGQQPTLSSGGSGEQVRREQDTSAQSGSEGASPGVPGQGKVGSEVPTQKSKIEVVIEETQSLLEKDNVSLLETDTRKLSGTLKDLDNVERVDLAKSVVDKLASNLESTEDNIRLKTVKSFKDTLPAVESLSDKKVFDELQGRFVVAEDKETNETIYSELAELLEYGVDEFLKQGNYTRTIEIVSMFRRHNTTKGEGFLKRCQIAEEILSKLSNPYVIGILISDLKSEDTYRKNQAYNVIMKLQTSAVPSLIEAIKETEDIHMRRIIAFAIKNMETTGIEKLVQELDSNVSPEIAKRIIDVLNGIGGSEVIVHKLKSTFEHYNPLVRKEIMRVLTKINSPEALEILLSGVNDADLSIRKEAVSMLGKLKSKESVRFLLPLLKQRSIFSKENLPDDLLEEICLALGKIGDRESIPVLIDIAKGTSFLTFKKQFSKTVRLASISSLACFIDPSVKEILHNLKNSKDLAISKSADNSLKMQERILSEKEEKLAQKIL